MFVLPHMCSDYNGNVVYYVHDTREASKNSSVGGGPSCFSAPSNLCRSQDLVPVSGEEMLVVGD